MRKRSKGFSIVEFMFFAVILAVLLWAFMPLFRDCVILTRSVVDSYNLRNAYGELVPDVQTSGNETSRWVELVSKPEENKLVSIAVFGELKDPDSVYYTRDENGRIRFRPFAESDAVKYVKITAYCEPVKGKGTEGKEENLTVTVSYEPFEQIEKP